MTAHAIPATPPVAQGYPEAVAAFAAHVGVEPTAEVSVASMRATAGPAFTYYASLIAPRTDVAVTGHVVEDGGGTPLDVRWYRPANAPAHGLSGAVVYVHGGGMVSGDLDAYERIVARYAGESGTPILAVDYRLAPEHPAPAAAHDVLRAVRWLVGRAGELRVDPARIALMGDSGGGGVAAAAAMIARDSGGPALSRLILVYPMLDDRTTAPNPSLVPVVTWTYEQNAVAWAAVTSGVEPGTDGHVAPARASDLAGLPPVHLETGDCDIFRDEVLDFAHALLVAGVLTDVQLYRGLPHAFDVIAPDLLPSRRALHHRYAVLRRT